MRIVLPVSQLLHFTLVPQQVVNVYEPDPAYFLALDIAVAQQKADMSGRVAGSLDGLCDEHHLGHIAVAVLVLPPHLVCLCIIGEESVPRQGPGSICLGRIPARSMMNRF